MYGHVILYIYTSPNQTTDHKIKPDVSLLIADEQLKFPLQFVWLCMGYMLSVSSLQRADTSHIMYGRGECVCVGRERKGVDVILIQARLECHTAVVSFQYQSR